MPKVSGIFEQFKDIDLIPIDDIVNWLPHAPNLYFIENYIANLLFYPQIIPDTVEELDIELAILRELLKKEPKFYDPNGKKIVITPEFVVRFPDLVKLALAFIDGYKPTFLADPARDVNKIILSRQGYQINLGTSLTIRFQPAANGQAEINLGKSKYTIKPGSLTVIPFTPSQAQLTFHSNIGKLLGKEEVVVDVSGGEVGLIIDAR